MDESIRTESRKERKMRGQKVVPTYVHHCVDIL